MVMSKVDQSRSYTLAEASKIVKDIHDPKI